MKSETKMYSVKESSWDRRKRRRTREKEEKNEAKEGTKLWVEERRNELGTR